MPTINNRGDYGIIFSGTSGTPGTYVDVRGVTQTQVQLVDPTPIRMPSFVESAYPHVGSASRFTLTVDVMRSAATVTMNLQGHPDLNPSSAWGNLWMFANYDPATNTTDRVFSATGRYILETTNLGAVVEACILITPEYLFDGSIVVRLQVEP
jgi:hypothetical protein